MGCVSSAYLQEDEGGTISTSHHHIVSLTSTTYGLLDHQPATANSPPAVSAVNSICSPPSSPEVINSWELMAGLDPIEEKRCPPGGEEGVVLYTTTLRGIRKTFEDCNAVRSAIEGIGVCVRERDVSMDLGFREELRELMTMMKGETTGPTVVVPPRLFVKGRYVGGAEQVLRIHEEGALAELLEGMPRDVGVCCDGCGGIRFLPCFRCSGSRKVFVVDVGDQWRRKGSGGAKEKGKVVRCGECNENGLVLCPICC